MTQTPDREFWVAVYRAVMALAVAIKRYKLNCVEPDTLPATDGETRTLAGVPARYASTTTVQGH